MNSFIPFFFMFYVLREIVGYKHAYFLGKVHGVCVGVTFQVGWIIIAILICTGNKCKLELGLGLGLGSGVPCFITCIIAVIFRFSFSLFKGIPKRVEIGKGILTGLLFASVIGNIVVYCMYDKRKSEQTKQEIQSSDPSMQMRSRKY